MAQHQDDPGLTTEQEAQVRRLLVDARHTEPAPDAVVARLDRVLADLAGEPSREATVVRLADRRRRAATMLVAAAASVAAVVGIGAVLSDTGLGGAADMPTSGAAEDAGAAPEAAEDESLKQADGLTTGSAPYDLSSRRMPFLLKADYFAQDVEVLKSQAATLSASGYAERDLPAEEPTAGGLDRVQNRAVCDPGTWGGGSYLAVLYDGAEGWVVFRRPQGETQIADLFLCGSESVVRSVTLPYP